MCNTGNKAQPFGAVIAALAKNIADQISTAVNMRQLAEDRGYLIELAEDFLTPMIVETAKQFDREDIVLQIYFQITPDATPQLSAEEFCAGVCIENIGSWKIREHNLTHIKDIVEENKFFKWWYFECIRMNVAGWTRVYFDPYLELDVITYSTPVWADSGSFVGVLGVDIDYNEFTSRINRRLVENIREDIETLKKEHESMGNLTALDEQYLNVNTGELISNATIWNQTGWHSDKMRGVMELVKRAAISDATVMLQGETGSGKDFIARTIHEHSSRAEKSFINVNCGALTESLIESELFGYGKGAFTGAKSSGSAGYFEAADGGTILLNEIGDLSLHLQVKLLNIIQDKEVTRIGETTKRKTDFRLIVASNKNLSDLVSQGLFREDLYYRVNVLPIYIPPLRERDVDIFPLITTFLARNTEKYGVARKLSVNLVNLFTKYSWPGNIRELQNIIERLVLTSNKELIDIPDLPQEFLEKVRSEHLLKPSEPAAGKAGSAHPNLLKLQKEDAEAQLIIETYKELGSSYKVADALGISQTQAYKKIKKYVFMENEKNNKG